MQSFGIDLAARHRLPSAVEDCEVFDGWPFKPDERRRRSPDGALKPLPAELERGSGLGAAVRGLALGPDGSIALTGTTEGTTRQFVALLDAGGGVRWKHDAGDTYGDRAGALATDGVHVVVAGDFTGTLPFDPLSRPSRDTDGYVAWFGASGVETVARGVYETVIGGMTLAGEGAVIAELVR